MGTSFIPARGWNVAVVGIDTVGPGTVAASSSQTTLAWWVLGSRHALRAPTWKLMFTTLWTTCAVTVTVSQISAHSWREPLRRERYSKH